MKNTVIFIITMPIIYIIFRTIWYMKKLYDYLPKLFNHFVDVAEQYAKKMSLENDENEKRKYLVSYLSYVNFMEVNVVYTLFQSLMKFYTWELEGFVKNKPFYKKVVESEIVKLNK